MNPNQASYFFSEFSNYLATPNHRYLSWEHCYDAFQHERNSPSPNFDLLSLHLAFYLASWGMYRGSSNLLQKDYLIHLNAINILWQPKYNSLWGKVWADPRTDRADIDLLFNQNGLIDELSTYYNNVGVSPTDTLITKIIMGTMGCLPAYDRFLRSGLAADGLIKNFGRNSFEAIINRYGTSIGFALPNYTSMIHTNLVYPQMKIIDCIYWQCGYYIDELDKEFKSHTGNTVSIINSCSTSPLYRTTATLSKSGTGYSINGGPSLSLGSVVLA